MIHNVRLVLDYLVARSATRLDSGIQMVLARMHLGSGSMKLFG